MFFLFIVDISNVPAKHNKKCVMTAIRSCQCQRQVYFVITEIEHKFSKETVYNLLIKR